MKARWMLSLSAVGLAAFASPGSALLDSCEWVQPCGIEKIPGPQLGGSGGGGDRPFVPVRDGDWISVGEWGGQQSRAYVWIRHDWDTYSLYECQPLPQTIQLVPTRNAEGPWHVHVSFCSGNGASPWYGVGSRIAGVESGTSLHCPNAHSFRASVQVYANGDRTWGATCTPG